MLLNLFRLFFFGAVGRLLGVSSIFLFSGVVLLLGAYFTRMSQIGNEEPLRMEDEKDRREEGKVVHSQEETSGVMSHTR